ncbi:carbonic anhydrase [Desulfurobacterium pacificum]|nr:carbonic anhydrase [Desulfurobacterium pacificum]
MTPKTVIESIFSENDEFVSSKGKDFFETHIHEQKPLITLVTCSDARVQPSIFSSELINNVFVIRNIGNQIENNVGSVDYGVFHLRTPVLLILGHVHCGAIKTFLEGYEDESMSIRHELDHLCIPVSRVERTGDFEKDWLMAVEENVHWQVRIAVERYGVLIKRNRLAVVGAVYDFANYYGKGYGRILIVNLNGDKNPKRIRKNPLLSNLPLEKVIP